MVSTKNSLLPSLGGRGCKCITLIQCESLFVLIATEQHQFPFNKKMRQLKRSPHSFSRVKDLLSHTD